MDSITPISGRALWLPAILLALAPAAGIAQVFKCTDDDGAVIYKQTPCAKAVAAPASPQAASAEEDPLDCGAANRFAGVVARYMRAGSSSNEVFDRYGGIDSLSRGTVGVINYVYSFRTNESITIERIAGLSQAKCEAEAFGMLQCESLPLSFTESQGGCGESDEDSGEAGGGPHAAARALPVEPTAPENRSRVAYARAPEPAGRPDAAVEHCKNMYRDQIEAIDAQMRRGYTAEQGERYREQLRGLTQKLRGCDGP